MCLSRCFAVKLLTPRGFVLSAATHHVILIPLLMVSAPPSAFSFLLRYSPTFSSVARAVRKTHLNVKASRPQASASERWPGRLQGPFIVALCLETARVIVGIVMAIVPGLCLWYYTENADEMVSYLRTLLVYREGKEGFRAGPDD